MCTVCPGGTVLQVDKDGSGGHLLTGPCIDPGMLLNLELVKKTSLISKSIMPNRLLLSLDADNLLINKLFCLRVIPIYGFDNRSSILCLKTKPIHFILHQAPVQMATCYTRPMKQTLINSSASNVTDPVPPVMT